MVQDQFQPHNLGAINTKKVKKKNLCNDVYTICIFQTAVLSIPQQITEE